MYRQLLRVRLHWYVRASGDLVLRHWQWLLLACLVVPGPPIVGVFRLAAALMAASASRRDTSGQHFLAAIVIDGVAVLWVLPQRNALSGGAFMHYVDSLPLPRLVGIRVDVTLLAAANNVILVAAVIAAAHFVSPLRDPYRVCCLLAVLLLAMIAQRAILTRHPVALLGVAVGNGTIVMGLTMPVSVAGWLAPIAAICCATAVMLGAESFGRADHWRFRGLRGGAVRARPRLLARRAPSLLIQCKAVAERPAGTVFRITAALALVIGADRLIVIFRFDGRAMPTAILAMAAICLVLAGFYRTLRDAHDAMATYLAALPLPPRYWPVRDTTFVLLLNGVPLVILVAPHVGRGLASFLVMFGVAVMYQVLLALLRWPLVHGGRRGALAGVLLTALWSGAAIAAVSR